MHNQHLELERYGDPSPLVTGPCYNNFMPQTLQALAEFTASRLIGDGSIEITKVASIAQAQPGDLVFVQTEDGKDLAEALASRASAVIAGEFAAALCRQQATADFRQSPAGVLRARARYCILRRPIRPACIQRLSSIPQPKSLPPLPSMPTP